MAIRASVYLLIIAGLGYCLAWLVRADAPMRNPVLMAVFAQEAHDAVNSVREDRGLTPLEDHQKLLQSLRFYVQSGRLDSGRLEDVFSHVERGLPKVHELAVNLVYDRNQSAILAQLQEWEDLQYGQHTHYAAWLFRDPDSRALGCLAVLARELPQLELPIRVDTDAPAYFDTCKLCGEGHGVSLARQSQNTLIVTCPHCDRPYNLIATDASGWWRRANQFFGGTPRPKLNTELSRIDQLMALWKNVAAKCQYRTDAQRVFGSDSWELPIETYRNGHGDCEDTSLLLVDLLIDRGFEARVALGRHQGDGHAWVVVREGDKSYLLESTWEDIERLSEPPLLEELAFDYEPKYLFDKTALYFLKQSDWTGDYWSDTRWSRVEYDSAEKAVELPDPEIAAAE